MQNNQVINTPNMKAFKVLIIGDRCVGKTSIIRHTKQFIQNEHQSTIGIEFMSKQIKVNDENLQLQICDTAGQEQFRSLTKQCYRGSYVIIVVYDVTNRDSFLHVQDWKKDITDNGEEGAVITLVGNKIDQKNERKVSIWEGEKKAEEIGALFFETSVKDNINVEEIFIKTMQQALLKPNVKSVKKTESCILKQEKIQEQPKSKSTGCC